MTTSTSRGIGIRTAAGGDERLRGQLHVYDGEGKGKSQAALGVVLRTIGLGICEKKRTRVLLLRFLKGPGRTYAEDAAIEALQQGFPHLIDQVRTGRGDHFTAEEVTRFDRQEAQRGWDIARGALAWPASCTPLWCSTSSTRCSTWGCWILRKSPAPLRPSPLGWR